MYELKLNIPMKQKRNKIVYKIIQNTNPVFLIDSFCNISHSYISKLKFSESS